MKSLFLLLFFALNAYFLKAQTPLSQFSWDSGNPTQATVGPNASSISASATIDAGGHNGSNGLNPGLPKRDIDLVLDASPLFDVEGIDIQAYYRREESTAQLFYRGNDARLDVGSHFAVRFRIQLTDGSISTVSSGNAYSIPQDDSMHLYQFQYDPSTSQAFLRVDQDTVWTHQAPAGAVLYWNSTADIIIGRQMDATGRDVTTLDQLTISSIESILPVEFSHFELYPQDRQVRLEWTTEQETNNAFFTIERSVDAQNWSAIGEVEAVGQSSSQQQYSYLDDQPLEGTSYYRIRQSDWDGQSSYTPIKSIRRAQEANFEFFPNPAQEQIQVRLEGVQEAELQIIDLQGRQLFQQRVQGNSLQRIALPNLPSGSYLLHMKTEEGVKIRRLQLLP